MPCRRTQETLLIVFLPRFKRDGTPGDELPNLQHWNLRTAPYGIERKSSLGGELCLEEMALALTAKGRELAED